MTNWGTGSITPDLTKDWDAIQILAFFQVCPDAAGSTVDIDFDLRYGDATIGDTTSLPLTATTGQPVRHEDVQVIKQQTLIGN